MIEKMTDTTARMASLLGRLRREMNGAVVEAMERAGVRGPLNYGVSIPTIRAIAAEEGRDHRFARYLYLQQVRELRMAALSIADPEAVSADEIDEWLAGDPSLELLDELALRLLSRCREEVLRAVADRWLPSGEFRRCYAAVMTLARARAELSAGMVSRVSDAVRRFPEERNLARAAVAYGTAIASDPRFSEWLASLPDTPSGRFVRDELSALFG